MTHKKTWLSLCPQLLLTMVLTFLEVFILGHYDSPSTERIQEHKPQMTQTGWHKTAETTKQMDLLMVTFEYYENCSL